MSTAAAKPFSEPQENEFLPALHPDLVPPAIAPVEPASPTPTSLYVGLLNGQLDALEDSVRSLIAHGCEDALRERLAKLLPPIAAPQPEPDAVEGTGIFKGLSLADADRLLSFHNCVAAFSDHIKRHKPDSAIAKRDAHCRDFLRAEIEIFKKGVTP
jgi:hypothetical protein